MSCTSVIITGVNGTPVSNVQTDVTVTGTTTGCTSGIVNVSIACGGQIVAGVATVAGGSWSVIIGTKCLCGSQISVTAICPDTPPCTATWNGPMACYCCPTIQINPPQQGLCNSQGQRLVTFGVNITLPPQCSTTVQIDFGDFTTGTLHSSNSTFQFYETHPYNNPGTYTATVNVISPSGCVSAQVQVTIDPCPPCATDTFALTFLCPIATLFFLTFGPIGA